MRKKIYLYIILFILLIGAVALIPLFFGYETKNVYMQQLAMYEQQLSTNKNVKLKVVEYHLGWLTSDATISVTIQNVQVAFFSVPPLVFYFKSIIHHGPIIYNQQKDQYELASANIETVIALPEQTRKFIGDNAETFLKINSILSIDQNTLLTNYKIESLAVGAMVKWDGLTGDSIIELAADQPSKIVGNLTFGGLTKPFDSKFSQIPAVMLSPILYNIDSALDPMNIWGGTSKLTTAGWIVDWQNDDILKGVNLEITTNFGVTDGFYNYKTLSSLKSLKLPSPSPIQMITNIKNTFSINLLNAAGMKEYNVNDSNSVYQYMAKIISPKSNMNVSVNFTTDQGALTGDFTSTLSAIPKNKEELTDNLNVDLKARAAVPLVVKVLSSYLPKPTLPPLQKPDFGDGPPKLDSYKKSIVILLQAQQITIEESVYLMSLDDQHISADDFAAKLKVMSLSPATKSILTTNYEQVLNEKGDKPVMEQAPVAIDPDEAAKKMLADFIQKGYITEDKGDYVVIFKKTNKTYILNGKDVSVDAQNMIQPPSAESINPQ